MDGSDLPRNGHSVKDVPQDYAHHHFVSQVEDDSLAKVIFVFCSRTGCVRGHRADCRVLCFTLWADAGPCNTSSRKSSSFPVLWFTAPKLAAAPHKTLHNSSSSFDLKSTERLFFCLHTPTLSWFTQTPNLTSEKWCDTILSKKSDSDNFILTHSTLKATSSFSSSNFLTPIFSFPLSISFLSGPKQKCT